MKKYLTKSLVLTFIFSAWIGQVLTIQEASASGIRKNMKERRSARQDKRNARQDARQEKRSDKRAMRKEYRKDMRTASQIKQQCIADSKKPGSTFSRYQCKDDKKEAKYAAREKRRHTRVDIRQDKREKVQDARKESRGQRKGLRIQRHEGRANFKGCRANGGSIKDCRK